MTVNTVNLRSFSASDTPFAQSVYASTRVEEMKLVDWTDDQKDAFLQMQYEAQTKHYAIHYPQAEYKIIQLGDQPVGRLIVENRTDHYLIIDIALLPEYRNRGIGQTLIEDLKKQAVQLKLPLVLRVEFFNPAIRLYQRLGFVKSREIQIYHEMVWKPDPSMVWPS
jgi:ribosomal protein S18 acetylase RimI-like enzyme